MTTALVPPRFEDFRVRQGTGADDLDASFFDRRFKLVAAFFEELAGTVNALNGAHDDLVRLGLARLNETVNPIIDKLTAAATLGFLTATSATPATLTLNTPFQLTVDENNGARAIFKPTPFLTVMRSAPDAGEQFATVRLSQYDPETGVFIATPIYVAASLTGQHSDWSISCAGGVTHEMADILSSAQSIKTDLDAAVSQLNAALLIITEGAVVSVNGQTGVVTIGIGSIDGLVAALAGKAASVHGHTIAEVANLQSALDAKAAISDVVTALDGKSNVGHSHSIANVIGLQTALDAKAAAVHAHEINDVTGLQIALDAKLTDPGHAAGTDVMAGTDNAKIVTAKSLADASGIETLTDAASIAWDMGAGYNAKVTIAASRQIAKPTNAITGRTYVLAITQGAGGNFTATWDACFKWGAAGAPALSTAAGKTDYFSFYCAVGGANPTFISAALGKGF